MSLPCDTSAIVQLDFNAATLGSEDNFKTNNAVVRFGGIATFRGEPLDLVIGEYTPSALSACSGGKNACTAGNPGSFGKMFWKEGEAQFLDDVYFKFERSSDGTPVTLPALLFSFADFEGGDQVHVETSAISQYWFSPDTLMAAEPQVMPAPSPGDRRDLVGRHPRDGLLKSD